MFSRMPTGGSGSGKSNDIKSLVPKMTGENTPSGRAYASETLGTNYPWQAFNYDLTNWWSGAGAGTKTLWYEFPNPVIVKGFLVTQIYSIRARNAKLVGRNSASEEWTTISATNNIYKAISSYNVDNNTAFKHWGITFDNNTDNPCIELLEFIGYEK